MSCKYCTRKPIIDDVWGYEPYFNSEMLAGGGYTSVNIGVDEAGKIIIYATGEDESDFYYPKYCPECGRRLRSDMDSIDEMYKNLRKCYECTIPQSCVGCPYNRTKRDILQYLEKQIGKEQNHE